MCFVILFIFQIVFCEGCSEVAFLVRRISENCMVLSKPKQKWLNRSWLTGEIQQVIFDKCFVGSFCLLFHKQTDVLI